MSIPRRWFVVLSSGLWIAALAACDRRPLGEAASERDGGRAGSVQTTSGIGGAGASNVVGSAGNGFEGGGSGAGTTATGSAGMAGGGAVGGTGAGAGAGGATEPIDPPADIAGRWGMFGVDDPVGVQLSEASDGSLTGRGCAAGTPGSPHDTQLLDSFCGQISGKVSGRTAWFAFSFSGASGGYEARVAISSDGRRMAGDFYNGDLNAMFLTAWLPVADDAFWLTGAPADTRDSLVGVYDLTLQPEASTGSAFTAGETYQMMYVRQTLSGDLGSFWWSEMSDPGEGSPLDIGPVSATRSDLPTAVTLDFDPSGFIHATARTPSGGIYAFAASRQR